MWYNLDKVKKVFLDKENVADLLGHLEQHYLETITQVGDIREGRKTFCIV